MTLDQMKAKAGELRAQHDAIYSDMRARTETARRLNDENRQASTAAAKLRDELAALLPQITAEEQRLAAEAAVPAGV